MIGDIQVRCPSLSRCASFHAGKKECAEANGGAPNEEESDEAPSEGASSGDEWTADRQSRDRRSRGSTARRAAQQQLQKLKAAKAAREKHKRRAAQAAARLTAGANTKISKSGISCHAEQF